ncbi:MAG: DUF6076 domain-containing protein [Hydrogenoanaerobacterium sp.]
MNSHEKQNKNPSVSVDHHEHLGYIHNNILHLQTNDFVNLEFDYVEAFLNFIEMDLSEFEEYSYIDLDMLEDNPFLGYFHAKVIGDKEKAFGEYLGHIKYLQAVFFKLVSFCFSETFYPEELEGMTAYQRLHLHATLPVGGDIPQELTEIFTIDANTMLSFEQNKKQKQSALEATFGIPAGLIAHIKKQNPTMRKYYLLHSAFEALTLAFYKMVEDNVKVKKCKKCDRYFVVKNKQNPDYCNRIYANTTQTCQQFAAVENFKKKNENNLPYQIFNLYYKRYHERKKVGSLKPDVFDKWNREACVKRDECTDGKITPVEFYEWIYNYFPNRPLKKSVEEILEDMRK